MKCGLCKFKVPDDAKICAYCDATFEKKFDSDKILNLIAGVFFGFVAFGAIVSSSTFWAVCACLFCVLAGFESCHKTIAHKRGMSEECT